MFVLLVLATKSNLFNLAVLAFILIPHVNNNPAMAGTFSAGEMYLSK
jgi:hypothetical protein